MITKTVLSKQEHYIEFTDEEMQELDIKPGDKFSWELCGEGVLLKKHVPLDIDLSEFDKDTLIFLIQMSCEEDVSVNEIICNLLEKQLSKQEY